MNWEGLLFSKEINLSHINEDFNNIIFSSSFRRLQNKTQIYPLEKNDFVRTRLTHSIEVSVIAESLGKKVEEFLLEKNELSPSLRGYLPGILKASGLIHDFGNPPFGHYGETIIQDYYSTFISKNFKDDIDIYNCKWSKEEINDFIKFESNAQAFRLIKKLQYSKFLNKNKITMPTSATIIKYPNSSTTTDYKFGYFSSERKEFHKLFSTLNLLKNSSYIRHPLSFLLESADDIAYIIADIEDACKKEVFSIEIILGILKEFSENNREINKIIEKISNLETLKCPQIELELKISSFRENLITFLTDKVFNSFIENYKAIMEGSFKTELLLDSKGAFIKKAYKEILFKIINTKEIIKIELAGDKILKTLLNEFTRAVISPNREKKGSKEEKLYRLISPNYKFLLENNHEIKNKLYEELHLVTDFICGMTDSYALDLYQAITAINH